MADSRKNVRFIGNPGERFLSALTEYSTVVTRDNVALRATVAESRKYLGMRIVEQLLLENQRAQAKIENVLTPLEPRYTSTHIAHPHDPLIHITDPRHELPPRSVSSRSGYSLDPQTSSRTSQAEYTPSHTPSKDNDSSHDLLHTHPRKAYASSGSAQRSAVHNGACAAVSESECFSTSSNHVPTQSPSPTHANASPYAPKAAEELSHTLLPADSPCSSVTGDGARDGYTSISLQPIEELSPTHTSPHILNNGSFGHGPSTGSVSNGSVYSSASSTRRKRWTEAGGVSKPIASILPPPPGVLRAQIQQQRAQQQHQQRRGSAPGGEDVNVLNGTFTEELPLVYADGVDPHSRSGVHASFSSQAKPCVPEYEEPRGPKGGVVVALDVTFRNNVKVPGNKSDGRVHSDQVIPVATFDDDEEDPESVPGGVLPGFTRRNSGFPGTQTGEIYCKRSPSVSSRLSYGSRGNHNNGQGYGQSKRLAQDSDNEDREALSQENNVDSETDKNIPEESDYGSRVHAARLKRMEERRTKLSRDNKDKGREEDVKMKEKGGEEQPASRHGERARSRSRPRNTRGDSSRANQDPPESSSTGVRASSGASTATTSATNNVTARGSAHHPAVPASEGTNIENDEEDTSVRDMIRHLKSVVATTTAASLAVSNMPNEAANQVGSDKEKKQDDREKTPKKRPIIASSNKKLILNALQYLCLAGNTHDSIRTEAITKVTQCLHNHFVILLKQTTTLKYSGIYISNVVHGVLYKLIGEGPEFIVDKYILQYYKYDSAGKQWSTLPSQKLTLTTDAITLNTKRNAQNLNKFNLVEG